MLDSHDDGDDSHASAGHRTDRSGMGWSVDPQISANGKSVDGLASNLTADSAGQS